MYITELFLHFLMFIFDGQIANKVLAGVFVITSV